jgi:molybdenum cofactor cytidylyltransferase
MHGPLKKPVPISAIVLAAGVAKRMGQLKQLLPLGHSTVLDQTIENLSGSEVDEIIIVLGYQSAEIKSVIRKTKARVIINPDYRKGMSSSIKAGLASVQPLAKAILLVLADQPFVSSHLINHLLREYAKQGKGILIPVYHSRRGHPIIISLNYKNELMALEGDIGAREIIARHPEDVLELKVESPEINLDIDTPEDYRLLKK